MSNYSYGAGSGMGGKTVTVTGNTYPHRVMLKSLGGRWDANTKSWTIPTPSNNKASAQLAYQLRQAGMSF